MFLGRKVWPQYKANLEGGDGEMVIVISQSLHLLNWKDLKSAQHPGWEMTIMEEV